MSTRPEDLGTRMSRASPSRPDARPTPRWLLKIMQERAGLHENAQERDGSGDSAHASGARVEGSGQSRDPQNDVDKVAGGRVDGQSSHDSPAAAAEDAAPLSPAPLAACDDVPPTTTGPSSCGADLEPFASSSRHSYGDFSSASSTASSSTSHSGFSSASASSFTSASSTQTFSAAGWSAGAQAACAPHALPSLAEVAVKASGDEAGDVDTTPVAEAPGAPVSAIDFEPTVPFAPTSAARLPTPSKTVSVSPAAPRPLSHVPRAPPAHFDPPSRPTSSQSGSDPASSGTLVNAHTAHQPPPSPSLTSTSGGGFAAPLPSDDGQCHAGSAILKHSNEGIDWDDGTLRPPENFAMVSPRLYRSSFPRKHNFPFLRSLGLKSVMVLVQEPYPEENVQFLEAEGIQFFQFGIPGNKEPFVSIPEEKIVAALSTILDRRNHPMLIHCNKGKHRTGCVVGCLRRLQTWSLTSVFDEYRRYSHPKSRAMDLQCIEAFGGLPKVWDTVDRAQLPAWATLDPPPLAIPPAEAPPSPSTESATTIEEVEMRQAP
ncbi:hypothetical protein Rhopal_000721-T1 [Rhodotorula paludigena]|uniref:diphosphoinositol-polyphosphate diphosphatase n=1 Tax=Rhodotorula paludigena TaxID=86838 RepID=A0AAV5G5G6_9BASI|nr:hypothetical protein Rhopal_000721-T1 [Rhodotorula paludigena]